MHRRSNLQTKQLAGSDSIYTYKIPQNEIICNLRDEPSAMRPLSNRMCSSYPYNTDGPFVYKNNAVEAAAGYTQENFFGGKPDQGFLGNGCHCAGTGILNPDSVFVDSFIRYGVPTKSPDRSYSTPVANFGGRFVSLPNYYTPYLVEHVVPPSYEEGGFVLGGQSTRNDYHTVWSSL